MQGKNKKVRILYDGITCYIDNPEYLELAKPNLRYILNKMKKAGNNNTVVVTTEDKDEYISAAYSEINKNFCIIAKIKSDPEYDKRNGLNYYEQKECLNEIYSVISGWMNNESKEEN